MTDAIGWAVIDNGDIRVKTISNTRRAAIVNWLVTERGCAIYGGTSDPQIERMWLAYRPDEVSVEPVTVTRAHPTG